MTLDKHTFDTLKYGVPLVKGREIIYERPGDSVYTTFSGTILHVNRAGTASIRYKFTNKSGYDLYKKEQLPAVILAQIELNESTYE
jgi:hypothetical protein